MPFKARRSPHRDACTATGVTPGVDHAARAFLSRSRALSRSLQSTVGSRRSQIGFTILELLTTLALIVVVMGLMVSLARYVRANSADQVTRRVLLELETQLDAYHARFRAFPHAFPLADDAPEARVADAIAAAVPEVTQMLRVGPTPVGVTDLTALDLRDAWGRPIGYLPHHHPEIGMAPQNRPFFFSAGPDGRYLTRQDNLYSYEQTRPTQLPPPIASGTGVDKANNAPGGE